MVVVVDLIYSLSILVALSALSGFIERRWNRSTVMGKVLQGILFGVVAILGIMFPFELEKGLIFDGRTIVISLCALFFGGIAGCIASTMAGIYRLWIGGVGLPMGLSTIVMAFVVGLVFNRIRAKFPIEWLTNVRIYLFGLIVHILMMILVVTLPSRYVPEVLQSVGLTVIGIYPLVTLIIGKILFDQEIAYQSLTEIRNRELLFRTTLYSIGDAVITTDEKGCVRNINQIAEKLTGWKESEAQGLHLEKVFNIVNEFSMKEVENPVQRVLREGVVVGLANHTLLISRDGRNIPISDSGAPIRDEAGKIVGVVLVFRDQTEERAIQRRIQESELRYRQFVYFNTDGISRFDLEQPIPINLPADEQIRLMLEFGYLAECNEVYAKMYGFESTEEIIGIRLKEHLGTDTQSNLEVLRNFIQQGYRQSRGITIEHDKWGNIKYFENNVVGIVEDGLLVRIWGMQKDVTETKHLEAALRESEEKFRLLAESSLTGIYLIQDLKFAYVNEALANTFGYEVEEVVGKLGPLDLTHPDDRPRVVENVSKRVSGEVESIRYDFKGLKKDGSIIFVEVHGRRMEYSGKVGVIGTLIDITDRKRAEEELKNSLKLFQTLAETTSAGILVFQGENIVYASKACEEISGYSVDEICKVKFWELVHPDHREMVKERGFARQKGEDVPDRYEFKLLRKDGNVAWVDTTAKMILWEGKTAVIASALDITERKRSEQILEIQYNIAHSVVVSKSLSELFAIVRSELSKLIDTSNLFIAFYDEKSDELTSPFEWDEMRDAPLKWEAKKSLTGIVIRKQKPLLIKKDEIRKLVEQKEIEYIGSPAEVWVGVPLKIGNKIIGAMVVQSYSNPDAYDNQSLKILEIVANQISIYIQRKRDEEEFIELSEVVRNSPVGILITNRNGIIEYVNPKLTEMTEWTKEEIIGNNPRIFKSGYHTNEFYKNLWDTILNGNEWHREIQNRKKGGKLYWEDCIIFPVKNDEGEITRFVAIKEDITEKKRMIQELIEAKAKAEESDRLKSAFLANISHEVRTPLNAILGFAQILYLQPITESEVINFSKIIYKRGQDLLRLFNDIIDVSLIDTKQLVVNPRVGKVAPLLYELRDTFSASEEFLSKGIEIRIGEIVPEDFEFVTDFFRVKQVLNNLIHNSLKFTQKGFVEFGCSVQEGGKLLFYVKDTGIGIPESKKDFIFGRFQQVDTDFLARPHQGLGLGLAISNEIVRLLGGKIWFESEFGKGTTFFVTIPSSEFEIAAEKIESTERNHQKETTSQLDSRKKYVFLIAEDEYSNFVVLEKFLQKNFNCEVLNARNGSEAVEIANQHKGIDLIIMDIRMPEKDGYTAFKEIRANNISVPIIALTAYAFPEDRNRIVDTGFDDYIAKPFEFEDIEWKIKKLLSEKEK